MTQNMTIIRKHVDPYVSRDSCQRHGIGIGKCRVCLKNDKTGDAARSAKHRAEVETLTGFPRVFSL